MPLLASRANASASSYGLFTSGVAPTGYFATTMKPALASSGTSDSPILPYSVVDNDGNIYTTGRTGYNGYPYLQKTSSTGAVLFYKHITNLTSSPTFIEIDVSGYVFLVSSASTAYVVTKFDLAGTLVSSYRVTASNQSLFPTATYFETATKYLYVGHSIYNGSVYVASWSAINTTNGTLPYTTTNSYQFDSLNTQCTAILAVTSSLTKYLGITTGTKDYILKDVNTTVSVANQTGRVKSLAFTSSFDAIYAGLTYFNNSAVFGIAKYSTSSFPTVTYCQKTIANSYAISSSNTFGKIQLDSSENPYIVGWANVSSVPRAVLIKFNASTGAALLTYAITGTNVTGGVSYINAYGGLAIKGTKLYISYTQSTGDNSGAALGVMSLKLSSLQLGTYSFPFTAGTMTATLDAGGFSMTDAGTNTAGTYSVGSLTFTVSTFTPTISDITDYESRSVVIPA